MSEQTVKIVFCTLPDTEKARQIGTYIVQKQLAACVNLIHEVESIYHWKGKIESGKEVLAVFKTTAIKYPKLESQIRKMHPYELPEIIAVNVSEGYTKYLDWILRSCSD